MHSNKNEEYGLINRFFRFVFIIQNFYLLFRAEINRDLFVVVVVFYFHSASLIRIGLLLFDRYLIEITSCHRYKPMKLNESIIFLVINHSKSRIVLIFSR